MRKLLVFIAPVLFSFTAFAQSIPFSISITVDEQGHGLSTNTNGSSSVLTGTLQRDPGPGGLANVLTYGLLNPPGLTSGDVLLTEGSIFLDVIRFNASNGTLVFYSDNIDGFDSLGDTFGPPAAFYSNRISIPEIGPEGDNFALYTPTAGQPGFVAGAGGPVNYRFISDSFVPEPSSFVLFGTGLAGVAGVLRRRFSRNADATA